MNIILSLGSLALEFNANFNIVYNIAKQLRDLGHNVILVGNAEYDDTENKEIDNIKFQYIHRCKAEKSWLDFIKDSNKGRIRNIFRFSIKHPLYSIFILRSSMFMGALNYKKAIKKIIREHNVSMVVAFTLPFETAYASLINSSKTKKIYYQLDPYGLYYGEKYNTNKGKKAEIKLIKKSDKVITTKALYKEYLNDDRYKIYKNKYTEMDFPLIIKKNTNEADCVFKFDPDSINIVFCGKIADEYRSPDFLLNIFKKTLSNIPNIKLYFLGDVRSKAIEEDKFNINDHIEIHEAVSVERANATMMSADILVNIGNNIPNMVPSKIFDYFSTGKPIINIEKIPNCPAKEYIEKYPMQLTINEYDAFDNEQQKQFEHFVLNSKHNSLDFHQVEKIFYTATPQYAAQTILDMK